MLLAGAGLGVLATRSASASVVTDPAVNIIRLQFDLPVQDLNDPS